MKGFFVPVILETEIIKNNLHTNQLYFISLKYSSLGVFINDVKVKKQSDYIVGTYKETNTIKLKFKGLLKSTTIILEINPSTIDVNISEFTSNAGFNQFAFHQPGTLEHSTNCDLTKSKNTLMHCAEDFSIDKKNHTNISFKKNYFLINRKYTISETKQFT